MNVAVIQFPGSNCDWDAYHAFASKPGLAVKMVWHKAEVLDDPDLLVIPGGFSFGDYLRCGAIARFSPVMSAVREFADGGGLVLGICNGFQILCEAGLLPGALIRNSCLEFRCVTTVLDVENSTDSFNQRTIAKQIRLPVAHGEGNYQIDDEGYSRLVHGEQILFRYGKPGSERYDSKNPNGSAYDIAGIRNREGNVFGMMPHPERAVESFHPSQDGILVLRSLLHTEHQSMF